MRAATDALSTTFSALADPTRRAILVRLADGAATVKDLSAPFDMSGPAISKHLRVLERAGLIQRGREAQWRPRTLDAAPLERSRNGRGGSAPSGRDTRASTPISNISGNGKTDNHDRS
jgi:DNA-binding transcriptional ArsR family regulator